MKLSNRFYGSIVITLFFLSFSTLLFAQTENIQGVRFKDGSVIHGKIIEMNIYKVTIEEKDGKVTTRKFDDVESFIKVGEKEQTETLAKKMHMLEIAPEVSSIEYKEPDVMKEKGMMFGIGASYSYHNDVMLKIEGRYSYGKVDYENSGKIDNIDDYVFEVRALGGYDFKIANTLTITPFVGFGYRYLRDDMAGRISSTGDRGYLREANYYYSPIGIEAVQVISRGWSVGAVLEYDYFWKGVQESHLSDVDSRYNDLSNDQNSGYGLRASIVFKKQSDRVYFTIEPFIRYWNIDESEIQIITLSGVPDDYGWEPKNNSTEIGLKLGIGF